MNVSKSRLARPIVAIVAIALTLGAWSGIAATAQDAPSGKLTVHVWGGPPDIESLRAAVADFTAIYPDIEVDVQTPTPACGVDFAACKILLAGGAMPDVFVPGIWNYNAMVNSEALLENLTPLMERDGVAIEDFHPRTVDMMTALKDGNVYGLPMGFNVQSLYYNKDIFDAAGLAYPPADGNYTWDDLRAWAKELTVDENGNKPGDADFDEGKTSQWGFTGFISFATCCPQTTEPILRSMGGSIMSLPDRETCNLEDPATIAGFQFIQDLMWTDHSTVDPQEGQEQLGFLRWVDGQVAMQALDHSQVPLIRTNNPSLNYAMAPLPMGPEGPATLVQGHFWSIYQGSENKEAAWELVKWLATEGAGLHGDSTQMGLIPAYKDVLEGPAFLQNPDEPEGLKEAQIDPLEWDLVTYPSQHNAKSDEITSDEGFGPAIEAIRLNKQTAAEALAGVCERVDGVMAQ